ncbi:MAG TPA: hypothetical protein VIK78_02825 [Ruminiclostridium sp.]
MTNWSITSEEKIYLRELAKKQLEYSMLPIMKEREKLWYNHNDLKGERPMIHFETWTFENDILPKFKCTSEAAQNIELQIYREILNHEFIGDDRVVPSWYNINWNTKFVLFNMKVEAEHATNSQGSESLGHRFKYLISDLQEDMKLIQPTVYSIDKESTLKWKAFVEDILGDILPVKIAMNSLDCCLSQDLVHIMGMETMIYSLVDYPDEFHQIMDIASKDHIKFMKWMEKEEYLLLNNNNNGLGNGSFGFSKDLPQKGFVPGNAISTKDMWGFMDSQETVSISPDMFGEFFFPYYNEVAKNFGLLSYGCCEPVHTIWEKYISKLSGLRKVSISPWCNEEYMGEALKGSSVIYHRKPSPNYVGVGKDLDEVAYSEHISKTLKCAKSCKLEFSFRDVYTLGGQNDKPRKAVEILRTLIEKYWE